MASLASHLASHFWLCLGHRTSVFLFPCYYSYVAKGRDSFHRTSALFENSSKGATQLGTGQRRQGEHNASVTYIGCLQKCLEHRPSGIKSPGSSQCCPSVSSQPPRRALPPQGRSARW